MFFKRTRSVASGAGGSAGVRRVALFHEFSPPPSGGGHQFLRALVAEFARRGVDVEHDRISRGTEACLFNSFNFDFRRLRRQATRRGCRMVHRVDGPIGVYRGFDDGTDERIHKMNRQLADATVLQSQFSLHAHQDLGMDFAEPVVIMNAPDPALFHPRERTPFVRDRKIRLISASWSDNPNKGAVIYEWLDRHLDWSRFEYTFAGRIQTHLEHIRIIPALPSEELAGQFRRHDIFIAASRNDPCSNALLEAMACGLPALYLNSGGHPELAGEAGLPFDRPEEIPSVLERMADEYAQRQHAIRIPSIAAVADRYLAALFPNA